MKIEVKEKNPDLCEKCHKEVSHGEEVLIKDQVVICRECSQKASAICHWCYLPIFKHELIHEVSEGWDIDGESRSENLIQCHFCYKYWLMETKYKESSLRLETLGSKILMFWVAYCLVILAFVIGWEPKNIADAKHKIWLLWNSYGVILLVGFLFIFRLVLVWAEDRKNKKKLKTELKKLKNHYIKK